MLPRIQILAAAVLMSTGGAAIKSTTLSAIELAALRSAVAAIFLLLCTRARHGPWTRSAFAVGAAMAATMVLFVAANKLTTAANTIFLQSTAPLWVLLAAPRLLGEAVRRRDVAHVLALAAGLSMFFVDAQAPSATAPRPLLGNVLAVASGVTWAATVVGIRRLAAHAAIEPPPQAIAATRARRSGRNGGADAAVRERSGATAAPALVAGNAIAFLLGVPWIVDDPAAAAGAWPIVLYLGVFQVGLGYLLLDSGVRHVPAVEASLLLLVEPALNPLWAWLVHGERPGAWALAGGAVILASTAVKTLADGAARRGAAAPAADG